MECCGAFSKSIDRARLCPRTNRSVWIARKTIEQGGALRLVFDTAAQSQLENSP